MMHKPNSDIRIRDTDNQSFILSYENFILKEDSAYSTENIVIGIGNPNVPISSSGSGDAWPSLGVFSHISLKKKKRRKKNKMHNVIYDPAAEHKMLEKQRNNKTMKRVKLFEEFESINEWNPYYAEEKDLMRIGDILKKASLVEQKDQRALGEAKKMAKLIKTGDKAVRRARAAQKMKDSSTWNVYQRDYGSVKMNEEERLQLLDLISAVFLNRALDLGMKEYLKKEEIEIVRGAAVSYDLGIL